MPRVLSWLRVTIAVVLVVLWKPKKSAEAPFDVNVPDTFTQAFVIEKDSKRFPKSGGWGVCAVQL
jgi:hypothetical protein